MFPLRLEGAEAGLGDSPLQVHGPQRTSPSCLHPSLFTLSPPHPRERGPGDMPGDTRDSVFPWSRGTLSPRETLDITGWLSSWGCGRTLEGPPIGPRGRTAGGGV